MDIDDDTPYEKLETKTSVIHLSYPIQSPPPPPPNGWTRFVCISDTHSYAFEVPPGDVLLHSGDLTALGSLTDFKKTMHWLYSLPHPTKIIIAGNHDLPLHSGWYEENYTNWPGHALDPVDRKDIIELLKGPEATAAGLIYLQNESYQFKAKPAGRTWTVYGSPWQPWFHNWGFNYQRGAEAEKIISTFPRTDILLTHGPPHGILDLAQEREPVGCEALRKRLPLLQPRLHVFGHIHEARGAEIRTYTRTNSSGMQGPSEVGLGPAITNIQALREIGPHTAFVNAANMPSGSKARALPVGTRRWIAPGGPNFQPVIVDLKDELQV